MRQRCNNPKNSTYHLYGGAGVGICRAWDDFEVFYDWAVESGYREDRSLALIHRTRNFSPKNCQWITQTQKIRNRSKVRRKKVARTSRKPPRPIDWSRAKRLYLNEGLTPAQVAREVGASYTGILAGLKREGILRPRPRGPTGSPEGKRLHKIWGSMIRKCTDQSYHLYKYTGARGIRVCRQWQSFERFLEWARATGSRRGLCLVRINVGKGYTPSNCEWMPRAEASRRRQPQTRSPRPRWTITAFGETKGPTAWAEDPRCMVSVTGLAGRIRRGMPPEDAITTPPQNRGLAEYALREVTAFGETKSLADWLRDRRCKVTSSGLNDRLRRGFPIEDALSAPPFTLRT